MIRRARKARKLRGSRTHGWGAGKKHRGQGNRGGRGNSGIGKRGAQKKSKWLALNNKVPTGKSGIQNQRYLPVEVAINLCQIEAHLEKWLSEKQIKKDKDIYIIDLPLLGYNKLLGLGEITHKLKVKAPKFSKSAEEKVKAAGGEIIQ